jgi:hypothetical protein
MSRQHVPAVAASVALITLTVLYMVSIIAIVLYIAYTPDRHRVGVSAVSPRDCMAQDLDLLGGVRVADRAYLAGHAEMQCTICLGDIEAGETLRELYGCKHGFHQKCIDQWLLGTPVFSLRCPLCRGNLCENIYCTSSCHSGTVPVVDLL